MGPNGDGEVVEEMQASSARSAIRRSGAGRQSRRNAPLCSVRAHVLLLLRPERNTFESSPLLGCYAAGVAAAAEGAAAAAAAAVPAVLLLLLLPMLLLLRLPLLLLLLLLLLLRFDRMNNR